MRRGPVGALRLGPALLPHLATTQGAERSAIACQVMGVGLSFEPGRHRARVLRWDMFADRGGHRNIVRQVRFTGWTQTQNGDRTVRREIRLVLKKYALPSTGELFDHAYAYIRENY